MYTYNLLVPDSSHEVLEIVDCCNVVVVHFDFHVRVDPPGREERWKEGGRRGGGRRGEGREGRWRERWKGGEWREGEKDERRGGGEWRSRMGEERCWD